MSKSPIPWPNLTIVLSNYRVCIYIISHSLRASFSHNCQLPPVSRCWRWQGRNCPVSWHHRHNFRFLKGSWHHGPWQCQDLSRASLNAWPGWFSLYTNGSFFFFFEFPSWVVSIFRITWRCSFIYGIFN